MAKVRVVPLRFQNGYHSPSSALRGSNGSKAGQNYRQRATNRSGRANLPLGFDHFPKANEIYEMKVPYLRRKSSQRGIEITEPHQWRHFPEALNPDYDASRGLPIGEILSRHRFLCGPDFLRLEPNLRPQPPTGLLLNSDEPDPNTVGG